MNRIIGVKAYGWDWSSVYGLSMKDAAQTLNDQGINFVAAQNLIDPLPGSAVDQAPPRSGYSDRDWTKHLQDQGMRVLQTTACFFQPDEFTKHPDLRPIDQYGETFKQFSWYVGICPTSPDFLDRKEATVRAALAETQPDGVFLSFFRFPGFWELWLPDAPGFEGTSRRDIREFCFCPRCLALFEDFCGEFEQRGTAVESATFILENLREEWTQWKITVISSLARRFAAATREELGPNADVMLNGFGLLDSHFDNAVREVLGQSIPELEDSISIFELMFYFQIQKRDPRTWIPERVAEVRQQTTRPILADLQGGAEYTEEIYAAGKRSDTITAREWYDALCGVHESGADGVLIYSWRDLLNDSAKGGSRVQDLLKYRDGTL